MTQQELARRLRITQGYLSKIEQGIYEASNEILERAAQVLDYPTALFFEAYRPHPLGLGFYRKHKTLPSRLKSEIDSHVNLHCMRIQKMIRPVELVESKVVERSIDEYGSPEAIARAIREYWRVPRGPIQNMIDVLEDAGIIVVKMFFASRQFSGVHIPTEQLIYIILINAIMPTDRERFTLAHELGHIIMHRLPTENMEEEANRFAGEFLMPSQEIASEFYKVSLEKLAALKQYWKISMAAILEQALKLSAISERKYRSLRIELAKYRLQEPQELDPPTETPELLHELINLYLNQLQYSIDELSQFLCLFRREFLSLYLPSHQHLRVMP
jgi:Zn-dependent peptidase ImmA (M78 family)